MRFNIFRSGRRLAIALGALWAIVWISFLVYEEPSVQINYAISWPGEPAVKVKTCEWGDVTLCFKAQKTSTGLLLVRYPGRNLDTAQEVIALSNGNKEKIGTVEFAETVRKFLCADISGFSQTACIAVWRSAGTRPPGPYVRPHPARRRALRGG